MSEPVLIKACLNGGTRTDDHPAVPLSPAQLARDGQRAVAAGAGALHVHARCPNGSQTLDPNHCAATLRALRARCPGVPVGLTTTAEAEPDPIRRLALVYGWTEKPDFVSVNFGELGYAALCALFISRGIGIEAGLFDERDVDIFLCSSLAGQCLRVLIEPQDCDAARAVATAQAMARLLAEADITLPQVHHGNGLATWTVLEAALVAGHDIRIGLEDTTQRPDGTQARDNAELVTLAMELARRHRRRITRHVEY